MLIVPPSATLRVTLGTASSLVTASATYLDFDSTVTTPQRLAFTVISTTQLDLATTTKARRIVTCRVFNSDAIPNDITVSIAGIPEWRGTLAAGEFAVYEAGQWIPYEADGTPRGGAGGGGGVTDHGALTGLADNDHPQYLNEAAALARISLRL